MMIDGYLGIDIDGTIRNWWGKVVEVIRREFPNETIDDNPKVYDISEATSLGKKIYDLVFNTFAKEIYTQAEPYIGAIGFIRDLAEKHEVVFLSFQPNSAIRHYTNDWLIKYGFGDYQLEYTNEKEKYPGLQVLLDDCTENLIKARKAGIMAVAIDRTWNQDWDGCRIKNYDEFFQIIGGRYRLYYRESSSLDMGKDAPVITNEQGGKQSDLPYAFHMIDPLAMLALAKVYGYGATKYARDNWRLIDVESHLNHAMSHIMAYMAGDIEDDHLEHAFTRLSMALAKKLRPDYLGYAKMEKGQPNENS